MIRRGLAAIRDRLTAPFRAFDAWQSDIPDEGRITVVGLALVALGFLPVWPPQPAAILPGVVLAGTGLGLRLAHPLVAAVTVGAVALIAVTWIAVN